MTKEDPYAGSAYYATEQGGGNSQDNGANDDLKRQIHTDKRNKHQRVPNHKSMGPQRFAKMGGVRTDLRFKQFPKSRPSRHSSTYLMWDETSLQQRGHFYAEKLAAISLRSQE